MKLNTIVYKNGVKVNEINSTNTEAIYKELIYLLTDKNAYINILKDEIIHGEKKKQLILYDGDIINYKYIITITEAEYSIIDAIKRR